MGPVKFVTDRDFSPRKRTKMLTRVPLRAGQVVQRQLVRNYGVSAPMAAQMDPIQQLFVDKVREYAQKSKTAGGKMVDVDKSVEQALTDELMKLEHQFGAKNQDMTKFPEFTFKDPMLDDTVMSSEVPEDTKTVEAAAEEESQEELDMSPFERGMTPPQ